LRITASSPIRDHTDHLRNVFPPVTLNSDLWPWLTN